MNIFMSVDKFFFSLLFFKIKTSAQIINNVFIFNIIEQFSMLKVLF